MSGACPRLAVPVLLTLLFASGCAGSGERWVSTRLFDRPRDEVVKVALEALEENDHKLEKAELEKGSFECKWRETLHHFRFEGFRTKAFAKVEGDPEKQRPGWRISYMVRKERNDAMNDPSNPDNADWTDVGFDDTEENILLYKVLGKLEPLELEKDFEERQKAQRDMLKEVDQYFDKPKPRKLGEPQPPLPGKGAPQGESR